MTNKQQKNVSDKVFNLTLRLYSQKLNFIHKMKTCSEDKNVLLELLVLFLWP